MQPHAGGHNAARAESSVDATRCHGCHHHALCCISILWGVNLVCLQLPVICSLLAFEGCSLVPSTCSTWVCGAVRRLPLRQYALLCSAQYIPRIRTPTLLLAATDDLFVWCIPACRSEAGLGQAPALHDLQHCVSCTLPPGSACWADNVVPNVSSPWQILCSAFYSLYQSAHWAWAGSVPRACITCAICRRDTPASACAGNRRE